MSDKNEPFRNLPVLSGAQVELFSKEIASKIVRDAAEKWTVEIEGLKKQTRDNTEALIELNGYRNEKGQVITHGKVSEIMEEVRELRTEMSEKIEASHRALLESIQDLADTGVEHHAHRLAVEQETAKTIGELDARTDSMESDMVVVKVDIKELYRLHRRFFKMAEEGIKTAWSWLDDVGHNWKKLVATAALLSAAFTSGNVITHQVWNFLTRIEAALVQEFKRKPPVIEPAIRGK